MIVIVNSCLTAPVYGDTSLLYPGWAEFEIDEISDYSQEPQIAVDAIGNVHLVYWQDLNPLALTYACRDAEGGLTIEEIATYRSSLKILNPAIAADSAGRAHIVYNDGKNLHYVTNREGVWTSVNATESLDVWGVGDIAVDSAGGVHIIACSEAYVGNVSYVTDASGALEVEMISELKQGAYGSYAVAVDQQDRAHLCIFGYNDSGSYGLWYASNVSGEWNFSLVDSPTSWNIYRARPSIAFGDSGEVYLAVTANYCSSEASVPSSEVLLYYQQQMGGEYVWHRELVSGSGYLPCKAIAWQSWGRLEIIVNEYFGIQRLLSYDPSGDAWGWGDSPYESVSCASADSNDAWHVVYNTDSHAREIIYSCNGFDIPDPPANLDALVDGTSVTISWSPPTDTGGLEIESYRITVTGFDEPISVLPNITSYTLTDLQEETHYTYYVTAVNQIGESYVFADSPQSFTTGTRVTSETTDPLPYVAAVAALAIAVLVVAFVVMRRRGTNGPGE
jgi:hypothetical protein